MSPMWLKVAPVVGSDRPFGDVTKRAFFALGTARGTGRIKKSLETG